MKKLSMFLAGIFMFFIIYLPTNAFTFTYGDNEKVEVNDKLIELKIKRIISSYGNDFDKEELKSMVLNQTLENNMLIDLSGVKVTEKEVLDYYESEWKNYNPDDEKEFLNYLIDTEYGNNKEEILILFRYDLSRDKSLDKLEKEFGNTEKIIVKNKSTMIMPKISSYSEYYDEKIIITGEEIFNIHREIYEKVFNELNTENKLNKDFDNFIESSKYYNESFKYLTIEIYKSQLTNMKLDIYNSAYNHFSNVLYAE
mgnify:FL=1